MGSQDLLFSYLAWWFSSWYFKGEKYWIASQSKSQNQLCNSAWSMGQGEGEFGFLPYWWFLGNIPRSACQLPLCDEFTECGQKSWWQCYLWVIWMHFPVPIENCSAYPTVAGSVCSLKLTHKSYSSWQKMQGETEHESLNVASPGTLTPWISKEFGKSFTNFLLFFFFSSLL